MHRQAGRFAMREAHQARLPARTHEDLQHAEGDADRQLDGLAQRGPPFDRQLQADDHQVAVLLDARSPAPRCAQGCGASPPPTRRAASACRAPAGPVGPGSTGAAIRPDAGRRPVRARAVRPARTGGQPAIPPMCSAFTRTSSTLGTRTPALPQLKRILPVSTGWGSRCAIAWTTAQTIQPSNSSHAANWAGAQTDCMRRAVSSASTIAGSTWTN